MGDDLYTNPSIGGFVLRMMGTVLCTEVWFYTMHRLLHSKLLYKQIHSVHHQYTGPSCLESAYVHPAEFLLNSFTVFFIGPLVTGMGLVQTFQWLWMVTFLQVHDHSGYFFPFLPPVLMHDYHHQRFRCCFGVLGLVDGICKTDGNFGDFVEQHKYGKNEQE